MNYKKYERYIMGSVKCGGPCYFHATADCSHLQRSENIKDRSVSFVRYHEAQPCEYCHGDT